MERVTLEELNRRNANGDKILGFFSAEWCGQCKMSKLLLEKVMPDFKDIAFLDIDVDDEDLWDHDTLKITQVPTYVGFKDKKIIFNASGYQVEENLINLLNQIK